MTENEYREKLIDLLRELLLERTDLRRATQDGAHYYRDHDSKYR